MQLSPLVLKDKPTDDLICFLGITFLSNVVSPSQLHGTNPSRTIRGAKRMKFDHVTVIRNIVEKQSHRVEACMRMNQVFSLFIKRSGITNTWVQN